MTPGTRFDGSGRAAPGTVGFLGNPDSLTQLTVGQSLVGTSLEGNAIWNSNTLEITAVDFTVSQFLVPCTVTAQNGTGNLTIENCIIDEQFGNIYGAHTNDINGSVTVNDTTIKVPSINGGRSAGIAAASDVVNAFRCDVSGFEDCIALGIGTVDKCYLHGLDDSGIDPHNDVIQHFPGSGAITVKNCYIVCDNSSGQPAAGRNACLTFDTENGCIGRNNFLQYGGFVFRIEGATNVVFEDNDFGSGADFGNVSADGAYSILSWVNNRDHNGNLIPSP